MIRSLLEGASACALGLASLAAVTVGSHAEVHDPVLSLGGRWAGIGTVVPVSGPSEEFKCVITYFPSDDGTRVRQNMRCRGSSNKFDAATNLVIQGGAITGSWQENTYSLTGTVSGAMTREGFNIQLSGDFFAARMVVVSSGCEQSVTVTPDARRSGTMKEMAARLRKC